MSNNPIKVEKRPSKSTKAMIDRLLNWHDENKPGTPERVVVKVRPRTVRKFAKRDGDQYRYRGRVIVPTAPPQMMEA